MYHRTKTKSGSKTEVFPGETPCVKAKAVRQASCKTMPNLGSGTLVDLLRLVGYTSLAVESAIGCNWRDISTALVCPLAKLTTFSGDDLKG